MKDSKGRREDLLSPVKNKRGTQERSSHKPEDECCHTEEPRPTHGQNAHETDRGKETPKETHMGEEHEHGNHHAMMVKNFKKRFWVSVALTVPILVLSPMIQGWLGLEQALDFIGDRWFLFAFASGVFFYGGRPFLKGIVEELRSKTPGMMTLIALAISVAYGYSAAVTFGLPGAVFFWELATLVDVMLLGHWIEMRSVMGASMAVESLVKLMPSQAHRLNPGGDTEDVPVSELEKGDRVVIRPGEKVPVDGLVIEGETSVNEAMLTGESKPVVKKEGAEVVGGSVNAEGSITVDVRKTGEESYLSQVVEMVRSAQKGKSRTQNFADKAAAWLTLVALIAGSVTLLLWLLPFDRQFAFALERTVTVMVITCPHALGLAIPLVVAVTTSMSASRGLLIRHRNAFERARSLNAILFDKTGTLTEGRFGVTDIVTLDDTIDKNRLLSYAAAVESRSEHPIARGIIRKVGEATLGVSDFKAITGHGAQGRVENHEVKVVGRAFVNEHARMPEGDEVEKLSSGEKTVVFVMVDGKVVGALALSDSIREESREAIARLKQMGVAPMMITGDSRPVAQSVARELGLDDFFAEVRPENKADKVKEIQSRGLVTAMVGDGINDAPALAQADIGIAIGAGTDVAAETADIILVRSNPLDVVSVIELSKASYRKMVQNLAWATGYNAVAIPLAAGALYAWGILLNPAVGALLMSASTVIVAINARMMKV